MKPKTDAERRDLYRRFREWRKTTRRVSASPAPFRGAQLLAAVPTPEYFKP